MKYYDPFQDAWGNAIVEQTVKNSDSDFSSDNEEASHVDPKAEAVSAAPPTTNRAAEVQPDQKLSAVTQTVSTTPLALGSALKRSADGAVLAPKTVVRTQKIKVGCLSAHLVTTITNIAPSASGHLQNR